MAATGGNLEDPYGEVLFIDCAPDEHFGRLPSFFAKTYPTHIPMRALLIDPLGNGNNVSVERIGNHCYFTDGWGHFRKVYGMENGAWLRAAYARVGVFEIRIKNYKMVEWIYPPIPEPLEGGVGTGGVNMEVDEEDILIANNRLFPFVAVKWVSFAEYTGDAMTLSNAFCLAALIDPDSEIYIIDEHGKRWPCFLRRGFGEHAENCVIYNGWARFCRRKGIRQDQKIMFGVTRGKSNNLHYIPGV